MKYIFYYIWLMLAKLHPIEVKMLYPIIRIIMKALKKSDYEYKEWKSYYNKAMLDFHGGIKDMFAFIILNIIVLIFIILLSYKLNIELFRGVYEFIVASFLISVIIYYNIYIKNRDWLEDRIKKELDKYSV